MVLSVHYLSNCWLCDAIKLIHHIADDLSKIQLTVDTRLIWGQMVKTCERVSVPKTSASQFEGLSSYFMQLLWIQSFSLFLSPVICLMLETYQSEGDNTHRIQAKWAILIPPKNLLSFYHEAYKIIDQYIGSIKHWCISIKACHKKSWSAMLPANDDEEL